MKGFTILELIIYIAIVGLMLVLVAGFIWNILEGDNVSAIYREVQQNGRQALNKINNIIAASIDKDDIIIDPGLISLPMENGDLDPTVIELIDGKIQITEGSSDPYFLTNEDVLITSLIFTNLSYPQTLGTIRTEMIIEYNSPSARSMYQTSVDLKSTISLQPYQAPSTQIITLLPNEDIITNLETTGASYPNHYQYLIDAINPDRSAVFIGFNSARDLYGLEDPSSDLIDENSQITKVTIFFSGARYADEPSQGQTIIKIGDDMQDYGGYGPGEYNGSIKDLPYANQVQQTEEFYDQYANNPTTKQPWTWQEIQDLRIGLWFLATNGYSWANKMRVEIEYQTISETLRPDGQDIADIGLVTSPSGGTNYIYTSDQNSNTVVAIGSASGQDIYSLDDYIFGNGTITRVVVFFKGAFWTSQAGSWRGRTLIKIGTTERFGNYVNLSWLNGPWIETEYFTNPETNNPWTWTDINNLKVGVWLEATTGWSWAEEVKVVVEFDPF